MNEYSLNDLHYSFSNISFKYDDPVDFTNSGPYRGMLFIKSYFENSDGVLTAYDLVSLYDTCIDFEDFNENYVLKSQIKMELIDKFGDCTLPSYYANEDRIIEVIKSFDGIVIN